MTCVMHRWLLSSRLMPWPSRAGSIHCHSLRSVQVSSECIGCGGDQQHDRGHSRAQCEVFRDGSVCSLRQLSQPQLHSECILPGEWQHPATNMDWQQQPCSMISSRMCRLMWRLPLLHFFSCQQLWTNLHKQKGTRCLWLPSGHVPALQALAPVCVHQWECLQRPAHITLENILTGLTT